MAVYTKTGAKKDIFFLQTETAKFSNSGGSLLPLFSFK